MAQRVNGHYGKRRSDIVRIANGVLLKKAFPVYTPVRGRNAVLRRPDRQRVVPTISIDERAADQCARRKFFDGLKSTDLILTASHLRRIRSQKEKIMLHLIWYTFVGFLVGCVAKALMHTHLSITWTVVLGIVGSIIGGAVTHLFYPPSAGGKFHLGGLIVSIVGAMLVLYIWHKFRLQLPRG
jgi:uncharacterized membrane protein YeaQ/YmgE (transglycosylase-associated protein family)